MLSLWVIARWSYGWVFVLLSGCVDNYGDNFVEKLWKVGITLPFATRFWGYVDNY